MDEPALPACAFAGFGLLARRPLMLVVWWLGVLALGSLLFGGAVLLAPPQRQASFVAQMIVPIGGPLLWLAATVLVCAVFREILQRELRLVGLRIGPDELRMAPAVLVLGFVLAAGMSPLLLSGRLVLAATAALLVVSPSFCLMAPAAFDLRWGDLMLGQRLAKGRYFDLLGMNLLTWGVYATASVLIGKLWRWLILVNDARIEQALHKGSSAMIGPIGIGVVLSVLIYGALLVIVAAPSAEAYRRLTSPPAPGP
jgi:hypothetical protein